MSNSKNFSLRINGQGCCNGLFLFVEDIAGKGHITSVIGNVDVLIVVCPIGN